MKAPSARAVRAYLSNRGRDASDPAERARGTAELKALEQGRLQLLAVPYKDRLGRPHTRISEDG